MRVTSLKSRLRNLGSVRDLQQVLVCQSFVIRSVANAPSGDVATKLKAFNSAQARLSLRNFYRRVFIHLGHVHVVQLLAICLGNLVISVGVKVSGK